MNTTDAGKRDGNLGGVLQEWQVGAGLPPRFQEQVWRRIADSVRGPGKAWFQDFRLTIEAAFRRPALAVGYVAILMLMGLSLGALQSRQEAARLDEALQARYVESVDPYQKAR